MATPDNNLIFGSFDGNVYSVSANGSLTGKYNTGKRVVSSPCMVNDTAFAICGMDNNLYLFNTQCRLLGQIKCGGKFFSTPIVMPDGTLFCCTMDGLLYFIAKETVEKILSGKATEITIDSEAVLVGK